MFWNNIARVRPLPASACLIGLIAAFAGKVYGQTEEASAPRPETRITSERVEMRSTTAENRFLFLGNVQIAGNNLRASCDRLEVLALREGTAPDATIGEIGAIREIIAVGNVVISQAGRTAYAGRAEIYPAEGRVLLTEDPRVEDERGVIAEGPRMLFVQGERRIIIEREPEQAERPRILLPSLPQTDFFKEMNRDQETGSPDDGENSARENLPTEGSPGEDETPAES